jgi:hypothetical protein
MSGLSQNIVKGIFQVMCTFRCAIGNPEKTITGTGFFVNTLSGKLCFITNKHNVDPRLKLGADTTYSLEKISLHLRKQSEQDTLSFETKWLHLASLRLKNSDNADVSVIFDMQTTQDIGEYQPDPFKISDIADEDYLKDKVSMMDIASFVGFPGRKNGKGWWDEEGNLPISRTVNISSYPRKPFVNSQIRTSDVILVSGLSFSGSSGSPIFLHKKGIFINSGVGITVDNSGYVPPKLIGIMSGHWQDDDKIEPEMFFHSGLSYFTKSTAILDLLRDL